MPRKLALVGLEGHVGMVLAGAKQLGDVEVVLRSRESADDKKRIPLPPLRRLGR